MNRKFYIYILIVVFIFQIAFSFYYSSEIINQNNNYNVNLEKFQNINKENLKIKKELSINNSLKNIFSKISSQSAQPIKEKMVLN